MTANLRHTEFWIWEFMRRNEQYRKEYNEIIRALREISSYGDAQRPSEELIEYYLCGLDIADELDLNVSAPKQARIKLKDMLGIFLSKYRRYPRDPELGFNSDDILKDVLSRDQIIINSFVSFTIPELRTKLVKQAEEKLLLYVNITTPLDLVLKEVKYHYLKSSSMLDYISDGEHEKQAYAALTEIREYHVQGKGDISSSYKKKRNITKAYARAIGIWIYDYAQSNSNKITHAIEALLEKYGKSLEALGKTYTDEQRIRKLYNITKRSISEGILKKIN